MQVLRTAQYLRHEQYGLGVVTESNTERTTIDFDVHGTKKFVTSMLVVELLAGEAPARARAKGTKKRSPRQKPQPPRAAA